MKAAVYYGREDLRWEDVPDPDCDASSVRIEVAHNGICGTDVHEFYDGPIMPPVWPHLLTGKTIPVILGHEFSGTVVEVGSDVQSVRVGDRVAVEPCISCGVCPSCLRGNYNLCDISAWHGLSTDVGGLAEYAVLAEKNVHRLPDELSLEQGAVIEPLSASTHASYRPDINPGDCVVIFGAGPIGLGIVLALTARGFGDFIVVEPSPFRRTCVENLKVDTVKAINDPSTRETIAAVHELTNGLGADVTFDAAGEPIVNGPEGQSCVAFKDAIAVTRRSGSFVSVATHPTTSIEPDAITFKELRITGSAAYCNDFPTVIKGMLDGHYPLDGYLEHRPAEKLHDSFSDLRTQSASKILIDMH